MPQRPFRLNGSPAMKAAVCICLFAGLLQGCYHAFTAASPVLSSCHVEDGREVVAHVFVKNSGLYLFRTIPIVCGNPDPDSILPVTFFRDTVSSGRTMDALATEVRRHGLDARATDISQVNSENVAFDAPGFDIPIVVPYFICFRSNQASCIVVRAKGDGK
jgi:hypothetical protein